MAKKKPRTKTATHELEAMYLEDMAGFCGLMGRLCKVFSIPWQHVDGEANYLSQKRAVTEWLTTQEFGDYLKPAESKDAPPITDDVEIPFG